MASPVPIQQKQAPPATATRGRMSLAAVQVGKVAQPDRLVIYGQPGVGKSSLAAAADAAIFLPTEDGTAHLDVARFPAPESLADVLEAVRALIAEDHPYRTFVLDTVDGLEPIIFRDICNAANKKSIEDVGGGFGKGYTAALDSWRLLLAELDRLRRAKGMRIVLLAHSHIKTFKNPEGDAFDRYIGKVNEKAWGLLTEWADGVLFARFQTYAVEGEKDKRVRGVSDGARVLCTTRTAAYDAKNRADLPPELPLSWDDLNVALAAARPADPAKLEAECAEMIPTVGDADGKLGAYLNTIRGDAAKLAHFKNRLAAKVAEKGA